MDLSKFEFLNTKTVPLHSLWMYGNLNPKSFICRFSVILLQLFLQRPFDSCQQKLISSRECFRGTDWFPFSGFTCQIIFMVERCLSWLENSKTIFRNFSSFWRMTVSEFRPFDTVFPRFSYTALLETCVCTNALLKSLGCIKLCIFQFFYEL